MKKKPYFDETFICVNEKWGDQVDVSYWDIDEMAKIWGIQDKLRYNQLRKAIVLVKGNDNDEVIAVLKED